jgi:hypothetical protein
MGSPQKNIIKLLLFILQKRHSQRHSKTKKMRVVFPEVRVKPHGKLRRYVEFCTSYLQGQRDVDTDAPAAGADGVEPSPPGPRGVVVVGRDKDLARCVTVTELVKRALPGLAQWNALAPAAQGGELRCTLATDRAWAEQRDAAEAESLHLGHFQAAEQLHDASPPDDPEARPTAAAPRVATRIYTCDRIVLLDADAGAAQLFNQTGTAAMGAPASAPKQFLVQSKGGRHRHGLKKTGTHSGRGNTAGGNKRGGRNQSQSPDNRNVKRSRGNTEPRGGGDNAEGTANGKLAS